jgi:hypothetical protein
MTTPDDDYNNPVVRLEREALFRRVQEDRANLSKLNGVSLSTMPEDIFVYYFLPLFAGEDTSNARELIAQWQRVASSPWMAVNIVNKAGEIVGQIPPLQESGWFTPTKDDANNLDYQMMLAQQRAAISPAMANGMIVDALMEKVDALTSRANVTEYLEKWEALLNRYGKSMKKDTAVETTSVAISSPEQPELEVDDWG